MRILSAISLILVGAFIILAVATYDPMDMQPGDWFLPAPRPVDNLAGPLGAWIALRLHTLAGYLSAAVGVIFLILGAARIFRWNLALLLKIIGYFIGWVVAVVVVLAVFAGEYRGTLAGNLAEGTEHLLGHLGSVGKYFAASALFLSWFLFATGIGFRRPALAVYNLFGRIVGIRQKYIQKRREKDLAERRKLIEQHRKRQEQIHRRIATSRTGKLVPGSIPEEILVPPGERKPKTQAAEELPKSEEAPPEEKEFAPGLTDEVFTPPPIIRTESEIADTGTETPGQIVIESEISPEPGEESFTPSPPQQESVSAGESPAKAESEAEEEEIIVSPPPANLGEEPAEQPATEQISQEDEEIPPWLLTEIPEQAPAAEDVSETAPESIPQTPAESEPTPSEKEIPSEKTQSTAQEPETPDVITPPESPGEEIEPAETEEEPSLLPEAVVSGEDSGDGELVLHEKKFVPPPIGLLHPPERQTQQYSEAELQQIARDLYNALKTFRVEGKIVAITPGPVITRFEFEPAPGIKISKIVNLADDIALALKTSDVRIVAPLPGKGTVGIEIPNREQETVYIRSVIESQAFQNTKAMLPLALGKKVAGEPVVADLAKMPHLLIAGATGSGKSVCINAIITSLIYKKTPTELRLLLIDPKRLELSIYNGIPYLVSPVVVEHKEASAALKWGLIEMERRYKKLAEARVRKLEDYNKLVKKKPELGEPLPYIVIIIDELADLMMTVGAEIEEPIARLAQMARAVGIHLIIATQRPSVDVVTGIIKANFPSRIAFKVRSKIDSRTILDMAGAERLLGHGDMLYLPSGFADPVRIHGSYVSTEETENLVEYLKQFENPQETSLSFREVIARKATEIELDDLFWEAAKIVVMSQKGSASHLQRKLRIGYTRAASIIDQLEAYGIVGPFEGSRPREVLIKTLEELDKLRMQMGG